MIKNEKLPDVTCLSNNFTQTMVQNYGLKLWFKIMIQNYDANYDSKLLFKL